MPASHGLISLCICELKNFTHTKNPLITHGGLSLNEHDGPEEVQKKKERTGILILKGKL